MVPKLAIVVRMGIRPFRSATKITVRLPEKFAKQSTLKIKTKQSVRLVFNDLAVAAISDAVEPSLLIT